MGSGPLRYRAYSATVLLRWNRSLGNENSIGFICHVRSCITAAKDIRLTGPADGVSMLLFAYLLVLGVGVWRCSSKTVYV